MTGVQTCALPISTKFTFNSNIKDVAGKLDFDYLLNTKNRLKFGVNLIAHAVTPSLSRYEDRNFDFFNNRKDTVIGGDISNCVEWSSYLEDNIEFKRFRANIGLNYSSFQIKDISFSSLQPRLNLSYTFKSGIAIKGSYAKMAQFVNVLVNDALGVPTDSWIPSARGINPAESDQFALGVAKTLSNGIEVSAEIYTKRMNNLSSYKEGSGFLTVEGDWTQKVTQGKGESSGIELLIQKNEGKLTGWIGYTLSNTTRQFDNINEGIAFPYKYDRRHEFTVVASYKINKSITFSANWTFATGNAITLPANVYNAPIVLDRFEFEDRAGIVSFVENSSRNGFRTRAIHRLDMGIEFFKKRKHFERKWNLGFYNAYNRANPFYFYFTQNNSFNGNGKRIDTFEVTQFSLIPILPYISFSIKF